MSLLVSTLLLVGIAIGAAQQRQKRHSYALKHLPYRNGTVYYYYAVGDLELSDVTKQFVISGMKEIENISCIKFKQVNPDDHSGYITRIQNGTGPGCGAVAISVAPDFSEVDRILDFFTKSRVVTVMEDLMIYDQCATDLEAIVHELFHVLGFLQQNTRDDWEQHITYGDDVELNEQIQPPEGFIEGILLDRVMDTKFDAASVMTYANSELGDGNVVFKNLKTNPEEGKGISELDIYRLNQLYNCPNFDKPEPPPNHIVEFKHRPCLDIKSYCQDVQTPFCDPSNQGTKNATVEDVRKLVRIVCRAKCRMC